MDELSCTTRHVGDVTVVEIQGEVDLATAPRLRETTSAAMSGPEPRLVVDLTGCTYLDSSGIAVLIHTQRRAHAEGGLVGLVCPPDNPACRKVLEITGLNQIMPIHHTRDEAVAAVSVHLTSDRDTT